MSRKIIVNGLDSEEVRIAIVNGKGVLEDFEIETRATRKNKGNIYKARVIAVEPALNAAFVDYGADKQGFLTANDVDPRLNNLKGNKHHSIDELLKPGMDLLVQVEKDEVGAKGAVLTTYLSLAGRYTVLMPGSNRSGVSRKIDDEEQRKKIKDVAAKLDLPEDIGFIVRTAGVDRTRTELNRDLKVLLRLWENIQKESKKAKAPALILKEQDVVIRALRDYFTPDVDEIILDSDDAFDRASEYFHLVMPKHRSVLTRYVERGPIFHHYRIEDQLGILYNRKVSLANGGSIVIEPTEALVSIDVNSGKQKQKDQEQTALETNTEAAKEVARQLRLRDLGGIIVVDFIDMFQRKNRSTVEKALKDSLKHDKARVKIGRISPNGTLELTRQRIQSALAASMLMDCPHCEGRGRVLTPGAHALQVVRKLRDRVVRGDLKMAKINCEPRAADILRTEKWGVLQALEARWGLRIDVTPDKSMLPGQHDFTFETDPEAAPYVPPEPNFGPPELPEGYEDDLPAAPEDEDVFDEDEADEVAAKSSSRRKRKKKSSEPAEKRAPEWDLPAFEFIDHDEIEPEKPKAKRKRKSTRSLEDDGGEGTRKKRARRGGRGRRKKRETVSAAELLATPRKNDDEKPKASENGTAAAAPKPAEVAAPVAAAETAETAKKPSWIARLFGAK
ncbi:MAG: Rne/Rng family ribonuclease [Myxococcota bacterium]